MTSKCTFKWEIHKGGTHSVETEVAIPSHLSIDEYVNHLATVHNIPSYATDDLQKALQEFITTRTKEFYDADATKLINDLRDGKIDIKAVGDKWQAAYEENVVGYAPAQCPSDAEVFGEVFHSLIHSPALEGLLNLEHQYSMAVEERVRARDRAQAAQERAHQQNMELAVSEAAGRGRLKDEEISRLAKRQAQEAQMLHSQWASELSSLKADQRAEYRKFVMGVHEDIEVNRDNSAYMQKIRAASEAPPPEDDSFEQMSLSDVENEVRDRTVSEVNPPWVESFTIHLVDRQLKTLHNFRIICADVLSMCRHRPYVEDGKLFPAPQRLQTAMSLYSDKLSGLVLLVDNRLSTYRGMQKRFAKVAELSTEFHFPDLEAQLEEIAAAVAQRNAEYNSNGEDTASVASLSSLSVGESMVIPASGSKNENERLQIGDVYVTRHSNLAEAHVVFHLVVDDSILDPDLSSRHPIFTGLSNIVRLAFLHEVYTLTLPLLLTHEMTEEMSYKWCQKRATTVFQQVKSYIVTYMTWYGTETRNFNFMVPEGISEDMLGEFSSTLKTIYTITKPVRARPSSVRL